MHPAPVQLTPVVPCRPPASTPDLAHAIAIEAGVRQTDKGRRLGLEDRQQLARQRQGRSHGTQPGQLDEAEDVHRHKRLVEGTGRPGLRIDEAQKGWAKAP